MTRERYLLHAAAVALALAATGTAHAAKSDADLAAAASPCCDDPSRFAYQALPPAGAVDFAIDGKSPLFEFQSGRSFFRAFRLPDVGRPFVVELTSFLDRPDSPRAARVFYPVVAVLTDDFLVSRSSDLEALRFDLPVLERTTAPAYRLQLPFDPTKTRERYLVVFTPAPLLEPRASDAATPDTAQQAARTAYLGASAFGRMKIDVRPLPAGTVIGAPAGADAASDEAEAPR